MILDGTGDAQNIAGVGSDSRLNNTLLSVHDYSFFVNPPYKSETSWANHLAGYIGKYASRTVVTEWGGPMAPGSKNGVHYGTINYSVAGANYFDAYVRGMSGELRALGIGSVYWPGLRDGDWYSLTKKSGSGSGHRAVAGESVRATRLQYAWGIGNGGGTYVRIVNAANGLYVDSAGGAEGRRAQRRQRPLRTAVGRRE